jgi:CubicO group peptidase (beta-lactamase class C family)
MKHALAIALLFSAAVCRAQEAPLRTADADRYLERMAAFSGFSGALLVMHDGKVVLEKGYGLADRARNVLVTPDTLFDIGSIVKTFTATAVQHFVDSGKVSLDDTLPKYFDGVPEDKRAITIRQLMTHTAGLPLYTGDDYELIPREKMVEMAFAEKLRFEPGTQWAYCNSCYSLLATILEKVSGKEYERYVHDHLLVPAGMTQTGYVIPNFLGRNVARGYNGQTDDGSPLQKAWYGDGPSWSLRGNGGFLSSVRELALWARALDGTKVAAAATKARAAEAVIATGRGPEKMAYGWFVQETPQGRMVSHSGGNGFFGNHLRRYVDRDVVVIFSTNNYRYGIPLERDVVTLLFGGSVAMPPEAKSNAPVAQHAGRYGLPSGREIELRLERGQLVLDPLSAPELATIARPSTILTTPQAKESEAAAKAAFERIGVGDVSLLTKVLPPAISADGETEFWTGWLAESEKTHGKFVSATPLWTIPLDDQVHTYVLMQFANGFSVVRWERRPNGAFAHAFPRHLPDLYRFVPQSHAELVAWNQAFRVTVPLRVEGDAIVLGELRATRVRQ